jgi:hypothetical protein
MTAQMLARLIATYRWLSHELTDQANTGATANGRQIREELDALFLEIVNAPSEEPAIACVQVDFLVSALAEQTHDAEVREMLREAVSTHVRHLASRIPRANRNQRAASQRH